MLKKELDYGVLIHTFNHLNKLSWLGHGFTARLGGVSAPPFHSFNLGKNTEDASEALAENYKRLLEGLGAKDCRIFLTNQVHGDTIQYVAYEDGCNNDLSVYNNTDGLMSKDRHAFLMSFYADCTPLFFADPINKVVAVSHAGWKGTCKNIGRKTVEKMQALHGTDPKTLLVGIGPSAGLCCYEVGQEVIEQLQTAIPTAKDFYIKKENGKYHVDVKKANIASICAAGVLLDNIEVSTACTICDNSFFSYRREGKTGRMSGFIYIK